MEKRDLLEYVILSFILVCVTALYLGTSSPVFRNDDSPETAVAAFTLGIGHPPGYPLFTMAAKISTLLPLASPAFRLNLFSTLLSMLVLLIAYFTVKGHLVKAFVPDEFWAGRILAYASVIILALSFIFWNQAVEAKGGIYALNLLFISLIILYSLDIFRMPGLKYFYSISFMFGLGLADHWMSMIMLAPALVYIFIKHRNILKYKGFTISFLFILLGLSAYLYLPVRAFAGPSLNWGNPRTLQDFLWVVLRKAYDYPVKPGLDVYAYQAVEFFRLFFTNYSLFILFGLAGAWAMLKTGRKTAWFMLGSLIIFIAAVVLYNRTSKGLLILEDIFMMPAEYICLLFIPAGMARIYITAKQNKAFIYCVSAAAAGLLFFMAYMHYALNDDSRDYLAYDLGKSIINTMEKDSLYFGNGDYNLMPVYYLREINNERKDIKFTASAFIMYKWGIDDFIRRYGSVPMRPMDTENNIKNIAGSFIDKINIYRSAFYPEFDRMDMPYKQRQRGILVKIAKKNGLFSPGIFDMYSYRGIYEKFCLRDPGKLALIGWYPASMVNQANDLSNAGRPEDALRLYKQAMLFPVARPDANIYYSMSVAYNRMKNYDDELDCLAEAVKRDNKLLPAVERAGILYYGTGILPAAKDMLGRAIEMGSASEFVKKAYNSISRMSVIQQYEIGLNKADDYLLKGDSRKALKIYSFLLERDYKAAVIERNMGLCYVKTSDFSGALNWFLRSEKTAPSPEAIYYAAYCYYRVNDVKSAVKELEEGLKVYNSDKGLNELYGQLKKLK